ncbi:DUF2892 domain-containing protein [Methylocapsa sp. D3K7]|uniref:YgaP family membrane protein n=1 Tax=Methylocapsa sp. D3K7 TaxID=3041435 RepID=UPI00244E79E0|nr:DUF2892 domain-containing protein [Methylocapsa sp. D3K7]WGJ15525.1 DUF2892 domain-containing protein [Methylocapsa sp. D3K7]
MTENVGTIDRAIRIVIGLALLSMLIFAGSEWKWLGLIGLVPLITALAGRCPAYSVMGIKTCAKSRQ